MKRTQGTPLDLRGGPRQALAASHIGGGNRNTPTSVPMASSKSRAASAALIGFIGIAGDRCREVGLGLRREGGRPGLPGGPPKTVPVPE